MESKMEDHGGFQAAYLRTDSVSFGRFEAESLSWERRSSFSHNRYLEEVEKCSTPGSVTQKKALLEAHFKKKGMLHQNSSLGKNLMEGQIDKVICEDKVDESEDPHINGLQSQDFQNHRKDSVQFSWYDETPVISDDPEDCVTDGEGEVSSVSKIPAGAAYEETLLGANNQQVEHEIVCCQVESDLTSAQEDIQGSKEKESSSKIKITRGPAAAKDRSAAKAPRDSDHVPLKKILKSSAKVYGKTSLEQKMNKTNTTSRSIATQKQERSSPDNKHIRAVKAPAKAPKVERDRTRVTASDKHMHLRASPSPATRLVKSNATSKDSETVKGSKRGDDKSMEKCEKSQRANRTGVTANSTSANREAVSRQSASRRTSGMNVLLSMNLKLLVQSSLSKVMKELKREKRQYNMKLEEKLLAKEAKMSEMQAKSQEERKTAMKQFRRSLTFKAVPMPSFYQNEANQSASGGKKVITSYPTAPRQPSSSRNTWVKVMLDAPNSTIPEVKTNSDQLISAEPCPEKLMEVPSEGSGRGGAAGDAKVSSQKIERDEKDTNSKGMFHQQQGESSNKVKKEEKSSKLKNSSTHKVMKGMGAGSTVVRVAS